MGRYKNVSGGPLDLIVPGLQCYVEDGEIVDIPDFQPDGVSPIVVATTDTDRPPRWEAVTDTKTAKAITKAADTSEKAAS